MMEKKQTLELRQLSRRRPGTSPISRSRLQESNCPATAAYIHGSSNPTSAAQTSRQEEASALSEGTATASSTFSLPVLSSEPASTVTLLEDGWNMQTELLPSARMQPPDYEDTPPEYCESVLFFCNEMLRVTMFIALTQEKIQNLLYLTEEETDFDSNKEVPDIFAQVTSLHTAALHNN